METIYNLPEPQLVYGREYGDFFVHVATLITRTKEFNKDDKQRNGDRFCCFPIDEKGVVHSEKIDYAGASNINYIHIGKKGKRINGYHKGFIQALFDNAYLVDGVYQFDRYLESKPILKSFKQIKQFLEKNDTKLYFGTKQNQALILDFDIQTIDDKHFIIPDHLSLNDRHIVFNPTKLDENTPECTAKTIQEILDEYFKIFPEPRYITCSGAMNFLLVHRKEYFKCKVWNILLKNKIPRNYEFVNKENYIPPYYDD